MRQSGASGDPGTGQGAMESAKEQAQNVAGQAQEQAGKVADQARQRTRGMVDERSTQTGQQMSTQAQDIRSVADQLREQGKDRPAKLADQAADRLERAGGWLTNSDGDRIVGDVEDFARRNPWALMAGGIALGFAASRMLKASSTERYSSRYGGTYAGSGYPRTLPPATGGQERFTRPASATTPATTPPPVTPPVPPTGPTTPATGRGGI
jgi:uncharacterized protein YjbJ (UPF0337 family)